MGLFSLKRSNENAEAGESWWRHAAPLLAAAAESIERHAILTTPNALTAFRKRLRALREQMLASDAGKAALFVEQIDQAIEDHNTHVSTFFGSRESDMEAIIAALSRTADLWSHRSSTDGKKMELVADELRNISQMPDLAAVRRRITEQTTQIQQHLESSRRESQQMLAALHEEVRQVRQRLSEAEHLALADPVTGLPNRRRAEQALQQHIASGQARFCVFAMEIESFREVVNRYGSAVGDLQMLEFVRRIRVALRSGEELYQWSNSALLAVVPAPLSAALPRIREFADAAAGEYRAESGHHSYLLQLSASIGIAEYLAGESPADLFGRADAILVRSRNSSF